MELSSPKIKKYLKFSHKKAFLVFQEMKPPKKLLISQEGTFRARKLKKPTLKIFSIFWETELSRRKL